MLDNSFKQDGSKPDAEGSITMIVSIPREDKDD